MRSKGKMAVVLLILGIFIIIGGYALYQLYLSYDAYAVGEKAYDEIKSLVISVKSCDTADAADTDRYPKADTKAQAATESEDMANDGYAVTVDFTALKSINPDAVGWICCPDTVVDYPVLAADDNSYYLYHLPDKSSNLNGSLFLDCDCDRNFSDKISVIYGHNLKSGKMFASLNNYKKQSYYDEHPYWYLYTETQNYRIAILYGAVVSAEGWLSENYLNNYEAMIDYMSTHSTFKSINEYNPNENLIVLVTCSYEYEDARYALCGMLQPVD